MVIRYDLILSKFNWISQRNVVSQLVCISIDYLVKIIDLMEAEFVKRTVQILKRIDYYRVWPSHKINTTFNLVKLSIEKQLPASFSH